MLNQYNSVLSVCYLSWMQFYNNIILINMLNSSPLQQNGRHFTDIFRCIFVNEQFCILINISMKFVPKGPIDNILALV